VQKKRLTEQPYFEEFNDCFFENYTTLQ